MEGGISGQSRDLSRRQPLCDGGGGGGPMQPGKTYHSIYFISPVMPGQRAD